MQKTIPLKPTDRTISTQWELNKLPVADSYYPPTHDVKDHNDLPQGKIARFLLHRTIKMEGKCWCHLHVTVLNWAQHTALKYSLPYTYISGKYIAWLLDCADLHRMFYGFRFCVTINSDVKCFILFYSSLSLFAWWHSLQTSYFLKWKCGPGLTKPDRSRKSTLKI